jgi:hypothetical protein
MKSVAKSMFAVLIALAAGCAALGVVAGDIAGEHPMPALYVPPQEPTLVLVENDRSTGGEDPDCQRVAHFIGYDLSQHKVVPLVTDDALLRLRENDPDHYNKMSIAALGQAAGAKQVIYVSIQSYGSDTPIGGGNAKWTASVKVRVVDTATGSNRWPKDFIDGEPLNAETQYESLDQGENLIRDELNRKLADKIGKVFHPWVREQDTAEDYAQ